MKKVSAVIIAIIMMISVLPFAASAETHYYGFGDFRVESESVVRVGDITESGGTLTINISGSFGILAPGGDCHIVCKKGVNLTLDLVTPVKITDTPFLTTAGTSSVYFDFIREELFTMTSSSAEFIKNSGNLTLSAGSALVLSGQGALVTGTGNLTVQNTKISANSQAPAISQNKITLKNADLNISAPGTAIYAEAELYIKNSGLYAKNTKGGVAVKTGTSGKIIIEESAVTAASLSGYTGDTLQTSDLLINSLSSVKAVHSVTAHNENGAEVYPEVTKNPGGRTTIIDDYYLPFNTHLGEKTLYPYITRSVYADDGYHFIYFMNGVKYGALEITSPDDDFPFYDIEWDFTKSAAGVKTEEPFTATCEDGAQTSNTIYCNTAAHITLDGVNIASARGGLGAISAPAGIDLFITLAEGSQNYLKGGSGTPAIYRPGNAANPRLVIDGSGALTAESDGGACVLTNIRSYGGQIELLGGSVTLVAPTENIALSDSSPDLIITPAVSLKYTCTHLTEFGLFDGNGIGLDLLTISNPQNKTLKIDGEELSRTSHDGETNYYAYLNKTEHLVEIGGDKYYYRWNGSAFEQFTPGDDYTTGGFEISGEPIRDYVYSDGILTVKSSGLTVKNADGVTKTGDVIRFDSARDISLTLDGVNIDTSASDGRSPVVIPDDNGADIEIILKSGSNNTLKAGGGSAAIRKNGNSKSGTLTLSGEGALTVSSVNGAGIGSDTAKNAANIKIAGGTITANVSGNGAGIGTGENTEYTGYGSSESFNTADNIEIAGGTLTVNTANAACIGAGLNGKAGKIILSGGSTALRCKGVYMFGAATPLSKREHTTVEITGGMHRITNRADTKDFYINDLKISGGVITIDADLRSVYTTVGKDVSLLSRYSVFTTDYDGEIVIPLKIDNPTGAKITIDGREFPYTAHFSEKAVYPSLTRENHTVTIGGKTYDCIYGLYDFELRLVHDHEFTGAYDHTGTHHWRTCKEDECYLTESDYMTIAESGYAEHSFSDFVCVCGLEDITGARENAYNAIDEALKNAVATASGEAAETAKTEIAKLKKVADINTAVADVLKEIADIENALTKAKNDAKTAVYNALDECGDASLGSLASEIIGNINAAKSEDEVAELLGNGIAELSEKALANARTAAIKEIDEAANGGSETVTKTAGLYKATIGTSDSIDEIKSLKNIALEVIEKLKETVHEHEFDTAWSRNEYGHYHTATCGCDVISGFAAHTFDEGAKTGDGTVYTCTVCGYEKTEKADDPDTPDDPAAPDDPDKPSVPACSKCGRNHAPDFFGKIACFFYRISNFFKNLFN